MKEWLFFGTGVVLALVGMWLTIYLRPGRRLNVHIVTVHLTDKSLSPDPEIALSFQGGRVNGIARHVIYLWNSGNVSVRASDIAADAPLRARFSEGSSLSLRGEDRVGQTFHLDNVIENNFINVKFDHLDRGQGFVFSVYEGIPSYESYSEPSVEGHILDSQGIKSGVLPFSASYMLRSAGMVSVTFFFIMLGATLTVIISTLFLTNINPTYERVLDQFGLFVIGMFFTLSVGQIGPILRWLRAIRYRVPKFPNLEPE